MILMWAGISLGFALSMIVLWRKLQLQYALQSSLQMQLEQVRGEGQRAVQQRQHAEEQLGVCKKAAEKISKEFAAAKEKLYKSSHDISQGEKLSAQKISELEDKVLHHRQQEQALTAQLQSIDQSNRELRQSWEAKLAEIRQHAGEELAQVKQDLNKARQQAQQSEQRLKRMEQDLATRQQHQQAELKEQRKDQGELEKLQGRVQQAEKLYSLMRSHKELTAERNEYLVKVCQKLASAVIDIKQPEQEKPVAFGPLVSMAMAMVRQGKAIAVQLPDQGQT